MLNSECPIWGTPASQSDDNGLPNSKKYYSHRTAGYFSVTDDALKALRNIKPSQRPILTTWIITQRRLGQFCPAITPSVVRQLETMRSLTVWDRRDHLLHYLASKIERIGMRVQIAGQVTDDLRRTTEELLAWTESVEDRECRYLVDFCAQEGLIEKVGSYEIQLTLKGYEHLEELGKASSTSSQVFVAMWFSHSMNDAYEKGIAPAIISAGYSPLRIDQKEHINKIDDEIVAEIRRSKFLVADFTSEPEKPRGGVYFEAGLAFGLNKPVIWTCHEGSIPYVHFDTRQFNHIVWDCHSDLESKLKTRILAVVGEGPLLKPAS